MTRSRVYYCLLSAGAALALFSSSLAKAQLEEPDQTQQNGSQGGPLDLLPLLDISTGQTGDLTAISPNGGYVRFWIERVEQNGRGRQYTSEERNALSRFFAGKSLTRLLNVRLTVNRSTPITQTATLAAASHTSNRRVGESWNTELSGRRFLTPYFRVDSGTTASVEISMSASSQLDPDITRNLLSIVERGARLAAPSAPLVTTLTSDRLNDAANFVDTAVARLFGEVIDEKTMTEFPAEQWYRLNTEDGGYFLQEFEEDSAKPLATITARFPMSRNLTDEVHQEVIGTWELHASKPIVSIFAAVPVDWRLGNTSAGVRCLEPPAEAQSAKEKAKAAQGQDDQMLRGLDLQACIAFSGLTPSRVLSFPVGENLTLGQALRGDSGITGALQRFSTTDGAANKGTAAREICILVAERTVALGFNAYDAAAALWAFAANGSIEQDAVAQINKTNCPTAELAKQLRLRMDTADPSGRDPQSGQGANTTGNNPAGAGQSNQPPRPAEPAITTGQGQAGETT